MFRENKYLCHQAKVDLKALTEVFIQDSDSYFVVVILGICSMIDCFM